MVTRKWAIPAKAAYRSQRIVDAMPEKFARSYSKVPRKLEKLFIEEGL
jgi:hypothetical protein